SVAILPLRYTRESWTLSAPLTECSVILSEASLRAESKDPHLVASSAWVADPSQAQDDSQPVEAPKLSGRCTKRKAYGAASASCAWAFRTLAAAWFTTFDSSVPNVCSVLLTATAPASS